jgi:hypothetical protein
LPATERFAAAAIRAGGAMIHWLGLSETNSYSRGLAILVTQDPNRMLHQLL